jgi:5-methylcytosine-specific restriction endonuclease McrA
LVERVWPLEERGKAGTASRTQTKFQLSEMEGDHIKPWREGGKTNAANCQMLCKGDNRIKAGR